MKQKTKGLLAFAFLGGILLTSTVLFAIAPPAATMTMEEKEVLDRFDFMMNACVERTSDLENNEQALTACQDCLLYTSPSPRDGLLSRMPSSA